LARFFRLHKWYLDCVASTGEAAIVYVGHVWIAGLRVPFCEVIAVGPFGGEAPVLHERRLSRRPIVTRDDNVVRLDAAPLAATGRWTRATPAVRAVLLDGPQGTIEWQCHQPGGDAEVHLPDGRILRGSGYVEELTMTCPPWALPFDELRWGRFAGNGRSVVWIDWRDGLNRRWVFADGAAVAATIVEDRLIEWPDGRLDLDAGRVVRDAPIGRTAAGPLAWCLPRRLSRATETKWVSRGRLREASTDAVEGWAIHEVVRWV
jgi:hypothetical protein